jgi:cytochrome c556
MSRAVLGVIVMSLWSSGCTQAKAPSAPTPPASLDTRTPVPLLPMMAQHQKENMRDHLAAVQEITAALGKDDFAGVETAVKRIGYSESMAGMCNHMGAAAPGFAPTAITFHRTADTIGEAAKKRDRAAVLAALGATLGTCVGCHASYRQEVVDPQTWTRLTAQAPPMAGQHGPH